MSEEKLQEFDNMLDRMKKAELKELAKKYLMQKEKARLRKAKEYERKKGAN